MAKENASQNQNKNVGTSRQKTKPIRPKNNQNNENLQIKCIIEERNKSLMAKCSRIIITAKQETTVKTLWKITKLQLLKQQTIDKIVGSANKEITTRI